MSAYMVEKHHIQYLVACARDIDRGQFSWYHDGARHEVKTGAKDTNASEVGQMLWDENILSIQARYPDTKKNLKNIPGPANETLYRYVHNNVGFPAEIDLLQLISSCECYQYQACEHDEWGTSQAKAMTDELMRVAARSFPGFDSKIWGAPEPTSKQVRLSDLC